MMKRSFAELMLARKDAELAQRGADVLEKMEHALTQDLLALGQRMAALQSECSALIGGIDRGLAAAAKESALVDVAALVESEPLSNEAATGLRRKFGKTVFHMEQPAPAPLRPEWGASFSYERARRLSAGLLARVVELGNAEFEWEFDRSELARTRRRMNALRRIIIPDLEAKRKSLEEWLDEENREELGRRRWAEGVVA